MTDTTERSSTRERETVERYLRFWNAETAAEQRDLASVTFTDDIQYCAPIGLLSGPQALMDFRNQAAERLGTVVFRLRGEPDFHHDRARLRWEIEARGERPFAAGADVLVFDQDGRVGSVTAFLDQAPEGFDPHAH
jgi:hypothetical protein